MAELQKTSIRPSFVIIVAGFQSGSLAHFNYTQERISMPALIVYGESDEIIPCGKEIQLVELSSFTDIPVFSSRNVPTTRRSV